MKSKFSFGAPLQGRLVFARSQWLAFAILTFTFSLWLLTRPYQGIRHDGELYAMLALSHADPAIFAHDPFIMFGSQDSFSAYSWLFSWLITWTGLEKAALLVSFFGGLLWSYSAYMLASRWAGGFLLAATLAMLISHEAYYGGLEIFSVGEGFASPRIFAEALVMMAIACWFSLRPARAWGLVIVAGLLHPLMAMVGAGALLWFAMTKRGIRAFVPFAGMVSGSLFILWALQELGALPAFDAHWRRLVETRSPFLFPRLWTLDDALRLALDVTLLGCGYLLGMSEIRRVSAVALGLLLVGMGGNLASDILDLQSGIAAQGYRVHWLAHCLAYLISVPLAGHLWRSGRTTKRMLASLLMASILLPGHSGALLLLFGLALYFWARYRLPELHRFRLPLWTFSALPALAMYVWLLQFNTEQSLVTSESNVWFRSLTQPPLLMLFFLVGSALWTPRPIRNVVSAGLIFSLAWIAVQNWDQRKEWDVSKDYSGIRIASSITAVNRLIPKEALVYWESAMRVSPDGRPWLDRGVIRTWFWLKRAHYVSSTQAAGNIFNRTTALIIEQRAAHLRHWGFPDHKMELKPLPTSRTELTPARLQGLCSDPALDFVITDSVIDGALTAFRDPHTDTLFAVYDCSFVRTLTASEILAQNHVHNAPAS